MPTPVIPILSVVHEKEAGDVEDALEAAKRYLPIKVFTAHKAVNAVGQAQVRARDTGPSAVCEARAMAGKMCTQLARRSRRKAP